MFWKRKTKQEKAVDSHRARILAAMKEDAENAGVFADFIIEALNRGYVMRVIVEVDGVTCPSGLLFPSGDFVEYLANWACAQKIVKGIKARKFEMQRPGTDLSDLDQGGVGEGNSLPGF